MYDLAARFDGPPAHSRMTRLLRALSIALLAALACAVSGCGSTGTKASSSSESGAKLVRPGVVAFVTVEQRSRVEPVEAARRAGEEVPGRDKALARIEQAFAKQECRLQRRRRARARARGRPRGRASAVRRRDTAVVALTKPDDPDSSRRSSPKLNANDSAGERAVYREVDGWYALSDKQASIDRVARGRRRDARQRRDLQGGARPGLGRDAREGVRRRAAAERCDPASGQEIGLALWRVRLRWARQASGYVAAAASAEDDGIRVHGA
mgnify:CR=1 FL=1